MADTQRMRNELTKSSPQLAVSCDSLLYAEETEQMQKIAAADALVVAGITPRQSAVEMGGMDDLADIIAKLRASGRSGTEQVKLSKSLLSKAQKLNKETTFISLRMPYDSVNVYKGVDHIVATYAYNQYAGIDGKQTGPAYQALANLLVGKIDASGSSPVTVNY